MGWPWKRWERSGTIFEPAKGERNKGDNPTGRTCLRISEVFIPHIYVCECVRLTSGHVGCMSVSKAGIRFRWKHCAELQPQRN